MALTRLSKLKKRFLKDPEFLTSILLVLICKHAEKVPEHDLERSNYVWYLPHHGVVQARKHGNLEWCLTQAQDSEVLHLMICFYRVQI